jgi:16S rRNA (adenine1518-N6/adenine1519-N6)-dimethyltransferase
LAAGVGDEGYGAVSVKVAYWATARLAGNVPRTVFLPKPNVDSALVAIERRTEPPTDAPRDRLFELVRVAFNQRRKMLRRSLDGIVDAAAFERAGVRPDARPEELDVVAWGRLATCAS